MSSFSSRTEREQWALHDTATYLDLGTDDAAAEADYARKCADWLGWKFEHLRGDPGLVARPALGQLGRRALSNHRTRRATGSMSPTNPITARRTGAAPNRPQS